MFEKWGNKIFNIEIIVFMVENSTFSEPKNIRIINESSLITVIKIIIKWNKKILIYIFNFLNESISHKVWESNKKS